ncbi:MAG: hypothetical protein ABIF40_02470 [archaeon]
MNKRGQATIFIILGIVLILLVILFFVFRSGLVSDIVETEIISGLGFSAQVEEVNAHVESCLKLTLRDAVTNLGSYHVASYESLVSEYIRDNIFDCINLDSFEDLDITTGTLSSVTTIMSNDETLISSTMDYKLTISKNDNTQSLTEFYAQIELVQNCCVFVEVDSSCIAQESGVYTDTCGMSWSIAVGQSMKAGGVCFAC